MAAALLKSVPVFTKAAFLVILLATATCLSGQIAQAQDNCSAQLNNLSVCAPFAMPGAASPSSECCGALRAVPRDCVCNMIQISASLPSSCSIPPLNCDN